MTVGVYFLLYAALMGTLALWIPLPTSPPTRGPGPLPAAGSPPRCLRLSWPSEATDRFGPLPQYLRLRSEPGMRAGWLRAEGGAPYHLSHHAQWQPAGPDSIDIRWHHSPLIRVAAHGSHRGGYVAWSWAAPLVQFPFLPSPASVTTAEVTCDTLPWAAT